MKIIYLLSTLLTLLIFGCASQTGSYVSSMVGIRTAGDIWTRGAAFPTNVTYLKTTYRQGDVILASDANKQNAEINSMSRWILTNAPNGSNVLIFTTITNALNKLNINNPILFDAKAWQRGKTVISDYTNTVFFNPSFAIIPTVTITIENDSMETLRSPVITLVTNNCFKYKVIGSGGLVNEPLNVSWIAIIN